ncbi:hypothetical protein AD951_13200 [Acetobacter malorum]|uniref:Uncharacterized protein n=1 Tax=Acetobacter malorum TaxID=178901 RepID=A0A149UJF6_9PROT|nr:hypothetical protein [Acetobacter malorum]KXV68110.1 hypothetical protein AD951_13200 [Acetobacter malorum]
MTRKANDDIGSLIRSARRASGRNTLALFMKDHFSDLQKEIGSRADWRLLTEFFISRGLKDASGQSPSPDTARQTWYRLRRRLAKEKHITREAVSPKVRFPDAGALPAVTPPAQSSSVSVRPAATTSHTAPCPDASATGSSHSAEDKLRRAQERIRAGTLPLPPRIGQSKGGK